MTLLKLGGGRFNCGEDRAYSKRCVLATLLLLLREDIMRSDISSRLGSLTFIGLFLLFLLVL